MTDRSNDAPEDAETPDDESADLSDAQLAAAAEDAAFEADTGEETLDDEAEDEAAEVVLEAELDAAAGGAKGGAPVRKSARERAAAQAARDRRTGTGARAARPPKVTRTPFAIDPALRIKDPASTGFVVATIIVFLLIFLNAMAFGKGGAFTVVPTRAPAPSVAPVPSVSPGPSGSPGARDRKSVV